MSDDPSYVVCTKAHYYPERSTRIDPSSDPDNPVVWDAGREIPEGSRWLADDPAVVAAPKKFAKES